MMKKTKFLTSISLALFFLLSCCSCDETEIIGNKNPEPVVFRQSDDTLEMEYNNIVAYTEYEEYSSDVETIVCRLQNNNPGKMFYLYSRPYVEKKIDGEWVRYYTSKYLGDWALRRRTDFAEDVCVTASEKLDVTSVTPAMDEGEYRLVMFVPGDETSVKEIYAEFRIVE